MLHRPEACLQAKLWEPQRETEQWENVANSTKQTNAVSADVLIQNSASATKGLGKLTYMEKCSLAGFDKHKIEKCCTCRNPMYSFLLYL